MVVFKYGLFIFSLDCRSIVDRGINWRTDYGQLFCAIMIFYYFWNIESQVEDLVNGWSNPEKLNPDLMSTE